MPDENTYFIDSASEAELLRLIKLDNLLNKCTNLLPKEFVPWKDARILDLACGPGGWALEVAERFPLVNIVAVDIDEFMIAYARAQAQVREQERVNFYVGDILKLLDFPDESFDFINARFLQGLMKTSSWTPLIKECFRLTRPGGIIRMTETGARCMVGCPLQHQFSALLCRAFWNAGMSFAEDEIAVTPILGHLLAQEGYQIIREFPYVLNLSYGTEFYLSWVNSARVTLQLIKPFILKYTSISETELDTIANGIPQELQRESHREHWFLTSIIGAKS
jgi:ubiquinone/menaquinone biosynthesis C-methylase UbiE